MAIAPGDCFERRGRRTRKHVVACLFAETRRFWGASYRARRISTLTVDLQSGGAGGRVRGTGVPAPRLVQIRYELLTVTNVVAQPEGASLLEKLRGSLKRYPVTGNPVSLNAMSDTESGQPKPKRRIGRDTLLCGAEALYAKTKGKVKGPRTRASAPTRAF